MFTDNTFTDQQRTTKYGIDKLQVMAHFIGVIETSGGKAMKNYDRFKSFICQQIKRGTTPQEEIDLMQGIVNYLQSEAGTNERTKAMNYLFNLEFLTEQPQ